MLQKFHRIIQKTKKAIQGPASNRKGQTAVILIILIAIGLILYAASLNMGRLTSGKVTTLKASEMAAAQMASLMASYGEKLFQEQLGGKEEVCGFTGVFTAFLLIIILIIIIVIAVFTCGAGLALAIPLIGMVTVSLTTIIVAAVIGIVAAAISMAIQAAYVDPKITGLWNSMMANLGPTGQFMEQGIQSALQTSVADPVMIPDLRDYDQDGEFGDLLDNDFKDSALDYVSRFAIYNTLRIQRPDKKDSKDNSVANFLEGLKDLLFVKPDGWGLTDPIDCEVLGTGSHPCCPSDPVCAAGSTAPRCLNAHGGTPFPATYPAICDPCCQPQYRMLNRDECSVVCKNGDIFTPLVPVGMGCDQANYTFACTDTPEQKGITTIAPECCYLSDNDPNKCGDPTTCVARSAYSDGAAPPFPDYRWVYEPFTENSMNNTPAFGSSQLIISFREELGLDDENLRYHVNSPQPNWELYPASGSTTIGPQVPGDINAPTATDINKKYVINDTSNFFPYNGDFKKGIFPFFYKMQDWFVKLTDTRYADGFTALVSTDAVEQCHWCDYAGAGTPYGACATAGDPLYLDPADPRYAELAQNPLSLPVTPNNINPALPEYYSGGWCVDIVNIAGAGGPQVPDKVPSLQNFFMASNQCKNFNDPFSFEGWRRGTDKFCTTGATPAYPYSEGCLANGGWHIYNEDPTSGGGCPETSTAAICRDQECGDVPADPNKGIMADDSLDEVIAGIPEFYRWGKAVLSRDASQLTGSLLDWYHEAADWIEPPCSCNCENPAAGKTESDCQKDCADTTCTIQPTMNCCPGSFTKYSRPGKLYVWRDSLSRFFNSINNWLTTSVSVGDDAWCVPAAVADCTLLANAGKPFCLAFDNEKATFNVNSATGGQYGDLASVMACLQWNSSDPALDAADNPIFIPDPANPLGPKIPALGNYLKFKGCQDAIENRGVPGATPMDICVNLPRTLLPTNASVIDPDLSGPEAIRWSISTNTQTIANIPLLQACKDTLGLMNPNVGECPTACATTQPFYDVNYGAAFSPPVPLASTDFIPADPVTCDDSIGDPNCPPIGYCSENFFCFGMCTFVVCNNSCREYISPEQIPPVTFNDHVALALADAQSLVPTDEIMIKFLSAAAAAAQNQVEKFKKRADFLAARAAEATQARDILKGGIDHLTAFLDGDPNDPSNPTPFFVTDKPEENEANNGPAEQLIWYRQHWTEAEGLSSVAIYVWQDEPLTKMRTDSGGAETPCGYSHAVKVEARLPRRCNQGCLTDKWPEVKTETRGLFERCYVLRNREGYVKSRVIRWDEQQNSSTMRFPSGREIWKTRYGHPDISGDGAAGTIWTACRKLTPEFIGNTAWGNTANVGTCSGQRYFGEAVMLNRPPDWGLAASGSTAAIPTVEEQSELDYATCWGSVHGDALSYGTVSESCAQYYFDKAKGYGTMKGFKLKYIPCPTKNW